MRTYSSGMYGRLAFSVAVNMDPDILLIDEALSVGDARFRRKSAEQDARAVRPGAHDRARQPRARHASASCATRRSGWTSGVLRMWDEPDAVVDAYTEFLEVGPGRGHARGRVDAARRAAQHAPRAALR